MVEKPKQKEAGPIKEWRPKAKKEMKDAVQEDVKKLKIQNWWTVVRDREVWRRILREAVTRPGLLCRI